MKKTKLIVVVISLILWISFVLIDVYSGKKNLKENRNYIKELNVNLTGVINEIQPLGHASGLLHVNLYDSNYTYLDEKEKSGRYFIVIKSNKAEIYITEIPLIKVNDSIVIDKRIFIYRDTELVLDIPIMIPNRRVLKRLKKRHKL